MRALVATLLVLAFCGVFLEFGAYVMLRSLRGYDGEHLMSYQFDPYKNQRLTPNYRDTRGIAHNAQGFRRSTDTPREKPEGTLRVFILGGSTAYGIGGLSTAGVREFPVIRNDETIDHYLQELIEDAIPGQRIEVINAAITSFYSHHHLIYLNQKILKFDPDLVIFIDGFNDYFPFEPGFDQFRDYGYQERATAFMAEPTFGAWAGYTGWWLVRKSHFFHLGGHALRNARLMFRGKGTRQVIEVDDAIANLKINAQQNWVKMVERNGLILAHEGIPALFTLQPEIAFDAAKTLSPLEQEVFAEMASLWQENFIDFKRQALPIVLEYLQQATRETEAHSMDLTQIYGGVEGAVYTDYCHLTPLGNRVLAEALEPRVLELLRERLAPAQPASTAAVVGVGS